ncbi:hypothetical protein PDQ34_21010 [Bacillus cereus]|nr:hypothetical protein [Bacillus cereus]MDA2571544.1 hypothetical protein [Bacillus cereus]
MKKKKIIFKVSSTALALSIGFTALAPTSLAFADEKDVNISVISNNNTDINFNQLYNQLNENKKEEFLNIVRESNLSFQEQIQLLQDRENSSYEATPRWKAAIIKKAAKLLAAKIGSKSVADITDYLFEWEDNLEQGMQNYLVYKLGWNKTAAHWTAKSVMFILF